MFERGEEDRGGVGNKQQFLFTLPISLDGAQCIEMNWAALSAAAERGPGLAVVE